MTPPSIDRDALATLIAVQEGRFPLPLLDDDGIRTLLRSRPRIAVVGASSNPARPSHGVMQELRAAGYDVVPVNPGEIEIEGLRCFSSVVEAVRETGPVDVVDVFRRADQCVEPARQASRSARAACGSSWGSRTPRRPGSPTRRASPSSWTGARSSSTAG
jgi:predicted CoA-binding protein